MTSRSTSAACLVLALLITCCSTPTHARSSGAPGSACSLQRPSHSGTSPRSGSGGYALSFGASATYVPDGDAVEFTLTGTSNFKGFLVSAFDGSGARVGSVSAVANGKSACSGRAATHSSSSSKSSVSFRWTPPSEDVGTVTFRATVVRAYTTWYMIERALEPDRASSTVETPEGLPCLNNCTSPESGECVNGQCHCWPGWLKEDCSQWRGPLWDCYGSDDEFCVHWWYDENWLWVQAVVRTHGWFAISVNPDDGAMTNADIWLMWVDDSGQALVEDRFSTGYFKPSLDDENNLDQVVGYERTVTSGPQSVVSFRRARLSSNGEDKSILTGWQDMAWAYGSSDTFSKHAFDARGGGRIEWLRPLGPPTQMPVPWIISATSNAITVGWGAPSYNGTFPVDVYTLQMRAAGDTTFAEVHSAFDFRVEVDGLSTSTEYEFRVSATNRLGEGPYSEIISGFTLAGSAVPPDAPAAPTSSAQTPTTITVDWVVATLPTDVTLVAYELYVNRSSGFVREYRGTALTTTITGFSAETTYDFQLVVVGTSGSSSPSPTAQFTTDAYPACPGGGNCNGNGACVAGECRCDEGFVKTDCSVETLDHLRKCWGAGDRWCINWHYETLFLYAQLVGDTTGWIGLMLGPEDGAMTNGDAIIAGVSPDGTPYVQDRWSAGYLRPALDTDNNIDEVRGYESGGKTIVNFKRRLLTADSAQDVAIQVGSNYGEMNVAWALGESDDFVKHALDDRGTGTLMWLPPIEEPSLPGAPTSTGATDTTVDLEWTAPAFEGGSEITGYTLNYRVAGSAGGSNTFFANNDVLSATVTGLTASTEYTFEVIAVNSNGQSEPATANHSTIGAAALPPDAPAAPTKASGTSFSVTLQWDEPNLNSVELVEYVLESSPASADTWTVAYRGTARSGTASGLSAATSYDFRVTATTLAGSSAPSAVATIATDAEPACPSDCNSNGQCVLGVCKCDWGFLGTACQHEAVTASRRCFGTDDRLCFAWYHDATTLFGQFRGATLGWMALIVNPDIDRYMVNGDCWRCWVSNTDTNAAMCEDRWSSGFFTPGLDSGSNDLTNVSGYQNASHSIVNFERALDTGNTAEDVAITDGATGFGDLPIAWAMGSTDSFTKHRDEDRGGGTALTFLVPQAEPSPPTSVVVNGASQSSVSVVWTEPEHEGGSPVSSYTVSYRVAGSGGSFTVAATGVSGTSRTITGLSPETEYEIQVQAVNADGTSSPVALDNIVSTLSSSAQVPAQPESPKVATRAPTSLSVVWTATETFGVNLLAYKLYYALGTVDSSSATGTLVYTGLDLSFAITGLSASSTYTVWVVAESLAGDSAPSPGLSVSTLGFSTCPGSCSGRGVCVQGVCQCNEGFLSTDCAKPAFEAKLGDVTLRWAISQGVLHGQISAKTTGWIGLIWDSSDGGMNGGDAWIFKVEGGSAVVEDRYSSGYSRPSVDSGAATTAGDLEVDPTGISTEVGGRTTVFFKRQLVTTANSVLDVQFTEAALGGFIDVAWAVGSSDSFNKHSGTSRGKGAVNLISGESSTEASRRWIIEMHGYIMLAIWGGIGVFGPMIAVYARRKTKMTTAYFKQLFKDGQPEYFKWHRGLQTLSLLGTIAAFFAAIIWKDGKNFDIWPDHGKYGVFVFLAIFMQSSIGYIFHGDAMHLVHRILGTFIIAWCLFVQLPSGLDLLEEGLPAAYWILPAFWIIAYAVLMTWNRCWGANESTSSTELQRVHSKADASTGDTGTDGVEPEADV